MQNVPNHWVKVPVTHEALKNLEFDPTGVKSSCRLNKQRELGSMLAVVGTKPSLFWFNDLYLLCKERQGDMIGNWALKEAHAKEIQFAVFVIFATGEAFYLTLMKICGQNGTVYSLKPVREDQGNCKLFKWWRSKVEKAGKPKVSLRGSC